MADRVLSLLQQIIDQPRQAYRQIVIVALIAGAVLIALHLIIVFITKPATPRPHRRWNLWEKLVYWLTILSVSALGVSAFYPVIRFGAMKGWFLLVHLAASGLLVIMLPLLAVTWANVNRFGKSRVAARRHEQSSPAEAYLAVSQFFWLTKITFWILLASGLLTIATMLASMYPIAGTDDMDRLLDIHRYSGLLLVVAAIFHLYGVSLQRQGLR